MNELESDVSDLSDWTSDEESETEDDISPIPYENFARVIDVGKLVLKLFFYNN